MNLLKYLITLNITLLDNVKEFLSSLTLIDVVFFFSVILLMVLLVVLLYFIKVNEDSSNSVIDSKDDDKMDGVVSFTEDNSPIESTVSQENAEFVEENETEFTPEEANFESYNEYDDEEGELLDLETITKRLENKELNDFDLSKFEEEQEKEAIISYDELISKARNNNINYKKETMIDDVSVKEVDLDNLFSESNDSLYVTKAMDTSNAISYAQEEAFLDALKQLQKQIN